MYTYIYIYVYMYIHTCVYVNRERERENLSRSLYQHLSIYPSQILLKDHTSPYYRILRRPSVAISAGCAESPFYCCVMAHGNAVSLIIEYIIVHHIHTYIYMCMYIYIYIEREREMHNVYIVAVPIFGTWTNLVVA